MQVMLTQLERAKPGLEAELATGKVLMRNASAPSFVQQTVEEVEGRMKLVDDLAKQRYKELKVRIACNCLLSYIKHAANYYSYYNFVLILQSRTSWFKYNIIC